jgi:Protein of unknown function (DUF4238)
MNIHSVYISNIMPVNKNQHYVPQLYLRNFSSNGNRIGLYHIPNIRFVTSASIRDECSGDYFYGKDEVINAKIENIESNAGAVLKKIIDNLILPNLLSNEHKKLWFFALLLCRRTKQAKQNLIEELTELQEYVSKEGFKENFVPNDIDAIQTSVNTVFKTASVGHDLAYKLVVNESDIDFFTSDNPVILYNQFLEFRNPKYVNTGLVTIGIQLFFPISPKLYLIFYDASVYKVGDKKQKVVATKSEADINELNRLQFINADKKLYFKEKFSEADFKKITFEVEKKKVKTKIIETPLLNVENASVLTVISDNLKCRLNLTFIKTLRRQQSFMVKNQNYNPRTLAVADLAKKLA